MRCLTLIVIFLSPLIIRSQAFAQLPDFPGGKRDDGVAVVVGSKAYFGTGLHDFFSATIDYRVLDLENDSWSTMQDMPHTTERQYAIAFTGNNCFYVSCGTGVGGALNNTWRYNVATNNWSQMASKPGAGLIGASCLQFNDKVIVAGGKFNDGKLNREVWEYDLNNDSWSQKNNFPFVPVWRGCAAVNDGSGYLLFGIDSASKFQRVLYRYDINADSWSNVSTFPLPQGRGYAALQSHNKRLFVFGGMDSLQNYYNDSWYYDPSVPLWFKGPDLPGVGRRGGMSCAAGEYFYYSCGITNNGRLAETWKTDVPAAVGKNKLESTFLFYPNPITDHLKLRSASTAYSWQISNVQGVILFSGVVKENEAELDCSHLSAGIYFLQIKTDSGEGFTKKLHKQ